MIYPVSAPHREDSPVYRRRRRRERARIQIWGIIDIRVPYFRPNRGSGVIGNPDSNPSLAISSDRRPRARSEFVRSVVE